jgi:hypothetical protein
MIDGSQRGSGVWKDETRPSNVMNTSDINSYSQVACSGMVSRACEMLSRVPSSQCEYTESCDFDKISTRESLCVFPELRLVCGCQADRHSVAFDQFLVHSFTIPSKRGD